MDLNVETSRTPNDGIFHPLTQEVFYCIKDYLGWYQSMRQVSFPNEKGWIGLLVNKKNWEDQNLETEVAIIKRLELYGHGVIPVFNKGSKEDGEPYKEFEQIVACYFKHNEDIIIDGLINGQIFLASDKGNADTILEQGVLQLQGMNIPVFRPIISYAKSVENWAIGKEGVRLEIPWSYTAAEMQGMIEPHFIAGRNDKGEIVPVYERIEMFVKRISKWVSLRKKATKHKKVAIMLHNAPCSGVEATIGLASGMDAFEGVVTLLKQLKSEGWYVENIPENGKRLYEMIVERKAWSDFRWTSVEDIVASGGSIHQMAMEGNQGYLAFYDKLEDSVKKQMEENWGTAPGEGMVINDEIVITGVVFGNVSVMVQPKRGCYSSKCTGEVCKILQNPECPPPHNYFATYKYIEGVMKADAVVHFGTHGSLEYLPGKNNALSNQCWPDIVLGALPNLYIYNAGVGTEGTIAKRRSKAVIMNHLPSVCTGVDEEVLTLVNRISEYQEACETSQEQADILEKQLRTQIQSMNEVRCFLNETDSFFECMVHIKALIQQTMKQCRSEGVHLFGKPTDFERCTWYIYEVITSNVAMMAVLEELNSDFLTLQMKLLTFIKWVMESKEPDQEHYFRIFDVKRSPMMNEFFEMLAMEIRYLKTQLEKTDQEVHQVVKALNGGYIEPGPSGWPDDNGRNILPTGRNLYLLNVEKIPTRAAYEVGVQMADKMLSKFLEEEGRYPENVAINMLSLDISRAKGEQLSQILYLFGVRPVWDSSGKVIGLEVLSTETLGRPRIDVTIRITGVLRDTYPHIYEMLDEAVLMVVDLPESEEVNFVKKQTGRIAQSLRAAGVAEEIERRSTLRVFGDRPGTFGAGVDLALKASAWETDEDLSSVFVYFSAFSYGKNRYGNPAGHEFVETAKNTEIAYDSSDSKRFDLLASSFGASVQGGYRLLKKVTTGSELKQYHGNRENKKALRVGTLHEELKQTVENTLLNPFWKENMKKRNYEGGAQFMQRLQNVFEWQCTTEAFQNETLDEIVKVYINDSEMQAWFNENNPYALEEGARRFLELHQRGRWNPNPAVLNDLKCSYLAIEGDMEALVADNKGEIQGGQIEIIKDTDVLSWNEKMKETKTIIKNLSELS